MIEASAQPVRPLPAYPGVAVEIAKASASAKFDGLADKHEGEIAAAVYRILSGLPDTKWAAELRTAIKASDWPAINRLLTKPPYPPEAYRALAEAVLRALASGTALEADQLPPLTAEPLAPVVEVTIPGGAAPGEAAPGASVPMPPELASPWARRWAQEYAFNLVRGLLADPDAPTRKTLGVVISEGIARGHSPRRVADAVDAVMGLTATQAGYVQNYRRRLEQYLAATGPQLDAKGKPLTDSRGWVKPASTAVSRETFAGWDLGGKPSTAPGGAQINRVNRAGVLQDDMQERRLRDFRQDGALIESQRRNDELRELNAKRPQFLERELTAELQSGLTPQVARARALKLFAEEEQKLARRRAKALSPADVDRMVLAYSRRWLKHRAVTIARTESIRALNAGRLASWQDAIHRGAVDGTLVFKRIVVAAQERLCPYCRGMARHYNAMNNGWGIPLNQPFSARMIVDRQPYIRPRAAERMDAPKQDLPGDATIMMHPGFHPNCRCTLAVRLVTPRMLG